MNRRVRRLLVRRTNIAALLAIGALALLLVPARTGLSVAGAASAETTNGFSGIRAVTCVDSGHCWAVADDCAQGYCSSTLLATSDGGSTWAPQTSLGSGAFLTGVSCVGVSHCWAAGKDLGSDCEEGVCSVFLLTTSDGGNQWTFQNADFDVGVEGVNALACVSLSDCWAIELIRDGSAFVAQTTDGGSYWNVEVPVRPGSWITCVDALHCWVWDEQSGPIRPGELMSTEDGGTTWTPDNLPFSGGVINAIACVDSATCWAVGWGPSQPVLLASTDGGKNWTLQDEESRGSLESISCGDSLHCLAMGSTSVSPPGKTLVLGTTDGGNTWGVVSAGESVALSGVSCPDAQHCWVVGATAQYLASGGLIEATADGGATWTEQVEPVPQAVPTGSPSGAAIADVMSRTTEPGIGEPFTPVGDPLAISDGAGGYLTAVKGQRSTAGTADSTRWLVFFWHNDTFVGWDTAGASIFISGVSSPQDGAFTVTYANYAPGDPICCPSLPPVAVTYQWDGSRLVADGTPPAVGPPLSLTPGP